MASCPIRVCILASQHVPDDVRVTHKIGMSFRKAGFRVIWIGPDHSRTGDDYGIDFRYYTAGRSKFGRLLHYRRLYQLASKLERVDIWYAVEPDSGLTAVRLARKFGGKAVMSIHEIYHDEMLSRWARGLLRKLAGALVMHGIRCICDKCDLVEAVGITRMEPYNRGRTPGLVIRHCCPRALAGDEPSQPFREDRAETVILHGKATVSRGTREAMQAVGLAAKRLSRPLKLLTFTPRFSAAGCLTFDQLDDMARQAEAEGCVRHNYSVPYKQMFEIMKGCDVGLILYNREWGVRCMPNRVFEYMAMGIPTIAPEYSIEMRAIVEKEKCGLLVDAEKPEAIAEAIVYLSEHPAAAREMGRRGREAFLANLNWEIEVEPLLNWIRAHRRPE